METSLEHLLTHSYKAAMINYLNTYPDEFEKAITLAISDKQPYSWRAAWLLWSCMKENDDRMRRYVKDMIDSLTTKNDNHQRELLKILLQMDLNEKQEGFLFHVCATAWKKIHNKPSVRLTAFKFLVKIATKYPDLSTEIHLLIQDPYMDSLSPNVRTAIFKMIKEFTLNLSVRRT